MVRLQSCRTLRLHQRCGRSYPPDLLDAQRSPFAVILERSVVSGHWRWLQRKPGQSLLQVLGGGWTQASASDCATRRQHHCRVIGPDFATLTAIASVFGRLFQRTRLEAKSRTVDPTQPPLCGEPSARIVVHWHFAQPLTSVVCSSPSDLQDFERATPEEAMGPLKSPSGLLLAVFFSFCGHLRHHRSGQFVTSSDTTGAGTANARNGHGHVRLPQSGYGGKFGDASRPARWRWRRKSAPQCAASP